MDVNTTFNVCQLNHIYNENFQYSLPQPILKNYLSGEAFDNKEQYTNNEFQLLCEDINNIYQNILKEELEKQKIAFITCGAPGSGKTTLLKQDRERNSIQEKHFAYICPDDICLKNMTQTYKKQIDNNEKTFTSHKNAYDKWRPGSNAGAHLILANLIRENYGFYFGTTATSPTTGKFLEFLKKQGYTIRLLHISAPDDIRWESIKERDKTFVQTTENDTIEKGLLFPQRIQDTYLKYADEIHFYYREGVKEDATLAAKWICGKKIFSTSEQESLYDENLPPLEDPSKLHIFNKIAYEKIKTLHNNAVEILDKNDLKWERTVESFTEIINNLDN